MKKVVKASEESVSDVLNDVDMEIRKMCYELTRLNSVVEDGLILSQASFLYRKLSEFEKDLEDMEV